MEILIIIILILLNGVFSMSEIAVISARKSSLSSEAKQGNTAAQSALNLANNPNRFLSTVQIGITLIGILTGIYSGATLSADTAVLLEKAGLSHTYSYYIAQTSIIIIVTFASIVFGELVPKRLGLSASEKIAKLIAKPMHILSIIASPFVWALSQSTLLVAKMLGIKDSDSKVTEEEIKSMIQEGTEDGEVQIVEQDIMERVFNLGDRDLESIMTYRSDIAWIDINLPNRQIIEYIQTRPFVMYPVADKELDNIMGVVYLKDMFGKIDIDTFDIREIMRPALYLHEAMEVYNALDQMKERHTQYGIVCDEFGGVQGIVTFKDILEALIGDLPSDHEEDPEIIEREDGSFLIDGQCPFYNFLAFFKKGNLYSPREYNTISGLILDQLGHIPKTGEKLKWHSFSFEIVDMDGARIDKILVIYTP